MSQLSKKKSNIIFIIFIILLILNSIGITYYFIIKHNSSKLFNTKNVFKFENVSRKDTSDVFKKYQINPIKIINDENEFSISGLKDKDIENKINEKLKKLKKKNNYCNVTFNVSNVFSAYCNEKGISIDLNTGNDIKLEEIFQKNSDLRKILMDSLYENVCNWDSYCQIPNDYSNDWIEEYDNNIENYLVEKIKKIYKNDYTFSISYNNIILFLDNWTNINYYNFPNDITIFDRFLNNNNIYENEVSDYCEIQSCYLLAHLYNNLNEDNYFKYYYLNDKVYINFNITNYTNINLLDPISNERLKKTNYDMNVIGGKVINSIIDKYRLNENDNYYDIEIYATIYGIKNINYDIVSFNIRKKEFNKDNFIKFKLGYYEAKTISESNNYNSNMIIKENEIYYLDSNPRDIFKDFDEILYKHILDNLKGDDDYYSPYYSLCCGAQFSEGYEKTDYKNIIEKANYSIDKNNKILLMSYNYETINIPWNIFEEKDKIE